MFALDAFHIARAQFAFTLVFHIVFPAFSIGLASYLAVLEAMWLRTGESVYLDLFRYWVKIFSIGFAMGVVSGLVMSYQFGTNWSAFSDRAGAVIAADGLRSADRVLPRGGVSGRDAVRHAESRPAPAFCRNVFCRRGHADFGNLDPVGQLLDADAARLHDRTGRPFSA